MPQRNRDRDVGVLVAVVVVGINLCSRNVLQTIHDTPMEENKIAKSKLKKIKQPFLIPGWKNLTAKFHSLEVIVLVAVLL